MGHKYQTDKGLKSQMDYERGGQQNPQCSHQEREDAYKIMEIFRLENNSLGVFHKYQCLTIPEIALFKKFFKLESDVLAIKYICDYYKIEIVKKPRKKDG